MDEEPFCISVLVWLGWPSCLTHTSQTNSPGTDIPSSYVLSSRMSLFRFVWYAFLAAFCCCGQDLWWCLRPGYHSQSELAWSQTVWRCIPTTTQVEEVKQITSINSATITKCYNWPNTIVYPSAQMEKHSRCEKYDVHSSETLSVRQFWVRVYSSFRQVHKIHPVRS